jgi:hypothetical protein
MNERWERELRKLDTVKAPAQLRERIDGSRRDPVSPFPGARQRVVAGVVAFGVFAAAAVFGFQALAERDGASLGTDAGDVAAAVQDELVITISSGDGQDFRPTASLSYGDERVDVTCTSYDVEYADGTGDGMESLCGGGPGLVVGQGAVLSFDVEDGVDVALTPDDPTASAGAMNVAIEAAWPQNERWRTAEATFLATLDILPLEPVDGSDATPDVPTPTVPTPTDGPRSNESEVPDVLRFRCDPSGIEVLTPVVAAQPDGLHVDAEVVGLDDAEIGLMSSRLRGQSWWSGSSGVKGEFVRPVPVGEVRFVCEPGPEQGSGGNDANAPAGDGVLPGLSSDPGAFHGTFDLIDPDGYFVDHILTCESRDEGFGSSAPPGEPFWRGWPTIEEAMRAHIEGLLDSDVIEEAGYPGGEKWPYLEARVVREGEVIAAAGIDGRAGWRFGVQDITVCSSHGLKIVLGSEG